MNSGKFNLGDPKWEFWDDFPGRMTIAKVDMLGTEDTYANKKKNIYIYVL